MTNNEKSITHAVIVKRLKMLDRYNPALYDHDLNRIIKIFANRGYAIDYPTAVFIWDKVVYDRFSEPKLTLCDDDDDDDDEEIFNDASVYFDLNEEEQLK
jgi:hypothetical protein